MAKRTHFQRTIYISDAWWARVKGEAKRRRVTISDLIRSALAAYLGWDDDPE